MENKNGFKEINIKNRTCYYFDAIMKLMMILMLIKFY